MRGHRRGTYEATHYVSRWDLGPLQVGAVTFLPGYFWHVIIGWIHGGSTRAGLMVPVPSLTSTWGSKQL